MDRTYDQASKYVWINWVETNKEARIIKNTTSEIKFKITMLSQVGATVKVNNYL